MANHTYQELNMVECHIAPEELVLFCFIMCVVIGVLTTAGNSIVIITIIKDPLSKLHTPFNFLLINLAVADFIIGAIALPVGAYISYKEYTAEHKVDIIEEMGYEEDHTGGEHAANYLTELGHMSVFTSGTASILSLITLSVDRLIAITHATKYKQYFSRTRCMLISAFIWLFSLSVPFLYYVWSFVGYLMFFAHSAIIVGIGIMTMVQCRVTRFLKARSRRMTTAMAETAPSTSMERREEKELVFQKRVTRAFMVMLGEKPFIKYSRLSN